MVNEKDNVVLLDETVADVESTLLEVKAVGSGQDGKSSIITLSMYNLQPSKPPCGTCHAIFTGPVYPAKLTML